MGRGIDNMELMLANFKKYLPLLQQFVKRDFKTKYRRSVLGVLWSVLNPLGMMIVLTMVFSTVFRQGIENFPVYLMSGQLIFNFFNEASSQAMNSIIQNGPLIKKVYIPKYLLPMASVCNSLVNLLTSYIALLIVMLITQTPFSPLIILSIIPIIYTFVFSYGMGLFLCTAATSFRDVTHLYGVLTTAWMYLTPIIYPMSMLPESIQKIVRWNPLTMFVENFRSYVLYQQMPSLEENFCCIVISGVTLLIGTFIFRKKQDRFIFKL